MSCVFHIFMRSLIELDSTPECSLIELDTILHRCEDTTGNLSIYNINEIYKVQKGNGSNK